MLLLQWESHYSACGTEGVQTPKGFRHSHVMDILARTERLRQILFSFEIKQIL